tara:strand:- start:165 stop:341 length:177 start_codon:yes stop_codon:yes gene_type:complete
MNFKTPRLRIKELSEALGMDSSDLIAVCTILKIPASSPLSSIKIEECKRTIDYIERKI